MADINQSLLLYWTDGENPPRKINIERFKSGFYGTSTNESEITAIKREPTLPMSVSVLDDPDIDTNNIVGKLFQFKYRYLYLDGEKSAWSQSTWLADPSSSSTANLTTKQNYINITYPVNTVDRDCSGIEIAASIKSDTNKDYFSILTTNNLPLNAGETFNVYNFYNDGQYSTIDVNESILSFDFLPQKAATQELVNGNLLVYGNVTDGYPNIDVSISEVLDYYLEVEGVPSNINSQVISFPSGSRTFFAISYTGIVETGDIFTITLTRDGIDYLKASYTALIGDDLAAVTLNLYNDLLANAGVFPEIDQIQRYVNSATQVTLGFRVIIISGSKTVTAPITQASSGDDSIMVYKQNSIYQFGFVYYDEFGRSGTVNTASSMVARTEPTGVNYFQQGFAPMLQIIVNHEPPEWATTYQVVRTNNLTHAFWLDWVSKPVSVTVGSKVYTDFSILTVPTFNEIESSSVLGYDFVKGDRLRIRGIATDPTGNNADTDLDFVIVGLVEEFDSNGDATKRAVRIDFDITGQPFTATDDVLFEVYRPKLTYSQDFQNVFYEIGEAYPIINGFHQGRDQNQTLTQPAVFNLTRGDCYLKQRVVPIASATLPPTPTNVTFDDVILEDPNFSDYYASAVYDDGKSNVIDINSATVKRPTTIVFSQTFVPQTNINGLNRFFPLNLEEYDRRWGNIMKLAVKDRILVTIQQLKTGAVPVNESIIEDQSGQGQVGLSQKLLNQIRYYDGDYGISDNPASFARFGSYMYWVDVFKGVVLRLAGDGLTPISMTALNTSYFEPKLKQYLGQGDIILGGCDPASDEFVLTFGALDEIVAETITFNENNGGWTSFYSFIPDQMAYVGNQFVTFKAGALYLHETNNLYNNFYGMQYNSEIDVIFNGDITSNKTFLTVSSQGSDVWAYPTITTNLGQLSELTESDFIVEDLGGGDFVNQRENTFHAPLLCDINSTGGIVDGDKLKGRWIKMKLRNDNTELVYVYSLACKGINSPQGLR